MKCPLGQRLSEARNGTGPFRSRQTLVSKTITRKAGYRGLPETSSLPRLVTLAARFDGIVLLSPEIATVNIHVSSKTSTKP